METSEWERRYKEGYYDEAREPHDLLLKLAPLVLPGAAADIAMGSGQDVTFLAERGFTVFGLEKSMEAIKKARQTAADRGVQIFPVYGDAKDLPLKRGSVDMVIVFYFLLRDIMNDIALLLRKGGILIYETFLKRQNLVDRHRNEKYLLDDGELLEFFQEMEPLFYEETIIRLGDKKRIIARYAGRRR